MKIGSKNNKEKQKHQKVINYLEQNGIHKKYSNLRKFQTYLRNHEEYRDVEIKDCLNYIKLVNDVSIFLAMHNNGQCKKSLEQLCLKSFVTWLREEKLDLYPSSLGKVKQAYQIMCYYLAMITFEKIQ